MIFPSSSNSEVQIVLFESLARLAVQLSRPGSAWREPRTSLGEPAMDFLYVPVASPGLGGVSTRSALEERFEKTSPQSTSVRIKNDLFKAVSGFIIYLRLLGLIPDRSPGKALEGPMLPALGRFRNLYFKKALFVLFWAGEMPEGVGCKVGSSRQASGLLFQCKKSV